MKASLRDWRWTRRDGWCHSWKLHWNGSWYTMWWWRRIETRDSVQTDDWWRRATYWRGNMKSTNQHKEVCGRIWRWLYGDTVSQSVVWKYIGPSSQTRPQASIDGRERGHHKSENVVPITEGQYHTQNGSEDFWGRPKGGNSTQSGKTDHPVMPH